MSETPPAFALGPGEEPALAAVLDALLPPSGDGRMPGAGALGLAARIEAIAAGSPLLAGALREGLASLDASARGRGAAGFAALDAGAREGLLRTVAEEQPGFVPGLLFHLLGAYYQHPRVLEGLGLEARPPFPKGYAMEPSDLDALLEPVRRRGALHRPIPDAKTG